MKQIIQKSLVIAGLFAFAYILLVFFFFHETKKLAIGKAEENIASFLLNHQAIQHYVEEIQKPEIYRLQEEGKLYDEYFSPKLLSSTYIARHIIEALNDKRLQMRLHEVEFKLVSRNPRNPTNQANSLELELLEKFNIGAIQEYKKIISQDGQDFLFYAIPYTVNKESCMRCHEDPAAAPAELLARYGSKTGFQEKIGEIRALISVSTPLDELVTEAHNTAFTLSAIAFMLLASILGTLLFFIRRIASQQEKEQKYKQEKELIQEKLLLTQVSIDSVRDCIYWIDEQANFSFVNNGACHRLGYSREELLSMGVFDVDPSFPPEQWAEHWQAIMQQGSFTIETVHRTKDGEEFPVEVTINNVEFAGKQYNCAIARDISERKASEEKLHESETRMSLLVNQSPMAFITWDKNFRVVDWNKASEKMFGYSLEEARGKHAEFIVPMKYRKHVDKIWQNLLELEGGQRSTNENITKEGETILCEWFNAPLVSNQNEIISVLSLVQDITEQKRIEEELFQAHKMEAIGTLAGGIAHDFNNILSAIIGFAEMAKLNISNESNATEDIDQVLKASTRATDLVQHILTFSRKSDHRLESIEPHLIIKEALKMLRASLPTTIEIQESIDSNCGKVMADQTNIHQIIVNLCTNSLHAMENEKGVLSVSLYRKEISDEEIAGEPGVSSGPFIVLKISDTGHGMDQATIEQIFNPYYTTKDVGKGTGLGLSVIHGIIKDYRGFIRVESELGKGTSFHVYIPALQQEIPTKDETKIDEFQPTGTERILVVDDESMIVNFNKRVLEQLGYEVTATTQSLDALEKIRTAPDQFDMIITDQTMPHLTGAELAQEILKIKPDMPIILCTGYSSVLSEEKGLSIGIKKYARKPVDRITLAKIVRQVLNGN